MRHYLYLHGFASSPGSRKAAFFSDRLAVHQRPLHVPDLNLPAFSDVTITRMLRQVEALIAGLSRAPVVLIGSSLGGSVALQVAVRSSVSDRIAQLVLLAPALDFEGTLMRELGAERLTRWRETGTLEVFHFGYNETRTVGFALHEDAALYDARQTAAPVPTFIFQGTRDETVDPAVVERYARGRPGIRLRLLDDDHQLRESLEQIWNETAVFLGLVKGSSRA